MHSRFTRAVLAVISTTLCLSALADPDHRDGRQEVHQGARSDARRPPAPHYDFDARFHHDHYYPTRGFVTVGLPLGSIGMGFGGVSFFFHAGVWYRPMGASFVVVDPPIGISIPVLPPGSTTVWIGPQPYYYANGVYYTASPGVGYTVVAPPPLPEPAASVQPTAPPAPIFYPRNGQSPMQTEADRQACNQWATTQPQSAEPSVFVRAVTACMEGRGYTVR
jgi:hypothetical protein